MNYRKVYMTVIANAIKENRKKLSRDAENYVYYEEHHVLPKSLFPAWQHRKSNLVLLTAREHFFCHQLLTKIYPSYSMSCALFYMCNGNDYQRNVCSSRDYERARIEFAKWNSIRHKGQVPWNKGKKCPQLKNPVWMHNENCRHKRSKTLKKRYLEGLTPWNRGLSYKELYSDDERKQRFGKNKGRKQSKEEIEKRSKLLKGQKRTEEQKLHYKAAAEKRAKRYKESGISKKVGEINKLKRSKPIYCPELDITFQSRKEAAIFFKTSACRIAEQIERTKKGKLYKGKYHIFEVRKEG